MGESWKRPLMADDLCFVFTVYMFPTSLMVNYLLQGGNDSGCCKSTLVKININTIMSYMYFDMYNCSSK